jgi:hypothetical protein
MSRIGQRLKKQRCQYKDSCLANLSLRYKISCDNFQNLNLLLTTIRIYKISYSGPSVFLSAQKSLYGFMKNA